MNRTKILEAEIRTYVRHGLRVCGVKEPNEQSIQELAKYVRSVLDQVIENSTQSTQ